MKRVELIKKLQKEGCVLIRHGAKRDIYQNPITAECQPVPRYREVEKQLARKILRPLRNRT